MNAAIFLHNPKTPYNVGSVIRNMAEFECAEVLRWTGERVDDERDHRQIANSAKRARASKRRYRLPREERISSYAHIDWRRSDDPERPLEEFIAQGFEPVCVEVLEHSESLPWFIHPAKAVYVFGPEDGNVPKGLRHECRRFVSVPTKQCLNLAVTTGIVLYDRQAKSATAPSSSSLTVPFPTDASARADLAVRDI